MVKGHPERLRAKGFHMKISELSPRNPNIYYTNIGKNFEGVEPFSA